LAPQTFPHGAAIAILHVAAQQFGSAIGLGLALLISIC
jgi:hypothetical protein